MSEERRSGPYGEHRHKPEEEAAQPGRRSEPVTKESSDPVVPDPTGEESSEGERDSSMVNDSSSEGGKGQSG